MKKIAVIAALSAAYLACYAFALAARRPAANLAYFVYSDNVAVDGLAHAVFMPAYWAHHGVCAALDRRCMRHNDDRPAPDLQNAPL